MCCVQIILTYSQVCCEEMLLVCSVIALLLLQSCTLSNALSVNRLSRKYRYRGPLYSTDNRNHEDIQELIATIEGTSKVGVVLLAGGKGKRMKSSVPKQFLPVFGKPVFLRSLSIFQSLPKELVSHIVIVLDESYRSEYEYLCKEDSRISWANPGEERQDSVYNGLLNTSPTCQLIAIHDAARPLVTHQEILSCLKDARDHGAAVLAVPMKATVKEADDSGKFVLRTIERSRLYEIHTPQIAKRSLFLQGFEYVRAHAEKLVVTDDVSVIEALQLPVKITVGEYTNLKLTTPEDLAIAEQILRDRGEK